MRKTNGVRSNKLDKDRIFISKRNPWRVSEAIYSYKFDSSSNPNSVLRSIHDPTISPNAAPRSTHVLRQIATDVLGIDTRSHDESGMLWYYLLRARQQPMRNPPIEIDTAEKYSQDQEQRNKRESKPTQYLTRFGNLPTSSGQGRELLIQQSITTRSLLQGIFKKDFQWDTIHEGSNPIFIAREFQGFRKSQLDSTPK